jgi:hypothetical protein
VAAVGWSVLGVEQGARFEEEFQDPDVRGHRAGAHGGQEIELRVVAEQPLGEWLDEPPLEVARAFGLAQAERGDDGQIERRVRAGAAEEFVGDEIGIADAERQRQHHLPADAPQRFLDDFPDVIKHLRHAATLSSASVVVNASKVSR